jgi:hypothetical protein
MTNSLGEERIGQIRKNKFGSAMVLEHYKNNRSIRVRFLEHGNLVDSCYRSFCNGEVRNVYDKTICGVGFIGEGKYKPYENRKESKIYSVWKTMLTRCYDVRFSKRHPTYKDCTVCKDWHSFQSFGKWYDENYYEIEGQRMMLDKDILYKGNKIYSPETCVFVPDRINLLFIKNDANRGKLPIGVTLNNINRKFQVSCSNGSRNNATYLGCYNTPEEAFQVYKLYKEKLIKQVAGKHRNNIPNKLYEAMIKYEVEISD